MVHAWNHQKNKLGQNSPHLEKTYCKLLQTFGCSSFSPLILKTAFCLLMLSTYLHINLTYDRTKVLLHLIIVSVAQNQVPALHCWTLKLTQKLAFITFPGLYCSLYGMVLNILYGSSDCKTHVLLSLCLSKTSLLYYSAALKCIFLQTDVHFISSLYVCISNDFMRLRF